MLLRTLCLLHRLLSLEVGLFLAIKLPFLAYSATEGYVNQYADCDAYLYFWETNDLVHPELEFCTKSLGCQTFDWDHRVNTRLLMIRALCQGVILMTYFLALMGIVWYQMVVDVLELIGLYYFWME